MSILSYLVPVDKIFKTWPNLKEFAYVILNIAQMISSVFDTVEQIVRKRRKCSLPAFFPIPTMVSKGFVCRVVKNQGML